MSFNKRNSSATVVKTVDDMLSCDKQHGFSKATREFESNREYLEQLTHLQTAVPTVHCGNGAGNKPDARKVALLLEIAGP